jgi:hypothetical protein
MVIGTIPSIFTGVIPALFRSSPLAVPVLYATIDLGANSEVWSREAAKG